MSVKDDAVEKEWKTAAAGAGAGAGAGKITRRGQDTLGGGGDCGRYHCNDALL